MTRKPVPALGENMFNLTHILYMVISGVLTAGLLVLTSKFMPSQEKRSAVLRASAILTVIIHYSNLWVEFFQTGGNAEIGSVHLLPVYPCNVVMWMLLIASLMKNKESKIFKALAEFCFWGGTVCGVVGIVLNINFGNTPTLADYEVLKGLLSHSTMVFGCIYMKVGGFIKIRATNAISVTCGLAVFVLCGLLVNGLYTWAGMEPPDGMFLLENPYIPVSPMILGIPVLLLLFGILTLADLRLPREERWYVRLKQYIESKKKG